MWIWIALTIVAIGMFVASNYSKIQVAAPPKGGCGQCAKQNMV